MGPSRLRAPQRGNILIIVLWVIVTLVILVMGLSFEARSDVERTILYRNRTKAYWLARAAVERVKYDYAMARLNFADGEDDKKTHYHYDFDEGYAECLVRSSSSLMPINTMKDDLWKQLFKLYDLDDQRIDEIVDCIMDWRDADDLVRLNGAETDYYDSLSPPYEARNGPFYSLEEIQLVKGVSEAMYYGYGGKPGLKDLLTEGRGGATRFDINSAPAGILMAFLEITAEDAQQIIQAREEKLFNSVEEAGNVVALGVPENLNKYFRTDPGNQITIIATAYINDSPARYTVEDEVRFRASGKLYLNLSHKDFSLEHVDMRASQEETR